MTYTQFREIVFSISDVDDFDHFVAERGWQDWMDGYTVDQTVSILSAVWEMRDNPVKGIQTAAKLTNVELSQKYGIPKRTIEAWRAEVRQCPDYTYTMLAYCVFTDKGII